MDGSETTPAARRGGHLVLAREAGQRILIGDDIVVEVREFRFGPTGRKRVILRVTAPADVRVDREEVRRRVDAAAADAGQAGGQRGDE